MFHFLQYTFNLLRSSCSVFARSKVSSANNNINFWNSAILSSNEEASTLTFSSSATSVRNKMKSNGDNGSPSLTPT